LNNHTKTKERISDDQHLSEKEYSARHYPHILFENELPHKQSGKKARMAKTTIIIITTKSKI
jgi:hypothetical protein